MEFLMPSPVLIPSLFAEDVFHSMKQEALSIYEKKQFLKYDKVHFRQCVLNPTSFIKLHHSLTLTVQKIVRRPVRPSYSFLSFYEEGGWCYRHVDRPQCRYTLDVCLSQDEVEMLEVAGELYPIAENQGLFYSGSEHIHYRPPIKGKHCFMIFFHYEDF